MISLKYYAVKFSISQPYKKNILLKISKYDSQRLPLHNMLIFVPDEDASLSDLPHYTKVETKKGFANFFFLSFVLCTDGGIPKLFLIDGNNCAVIVQGKTTLMNYDSLPTDIIVHAAGFCHPRVRRVLNYSIPIANLPKSPGSPMNTLLRQSITEIIGNVENLQFDQYIKACLENPEIFGNEYGRFTLWVRSYSMLTALNSGTSLQNLIIFVQSLFYALPTHQSKLLTEHYRLMNNLILYYSNKPQHVSVIQQLISNSIKKEHNFICNNSPDNFQSTILFYHDFEKKMSIKTAFKKFNEGYQWAIKSLPSNQIPQITYDMLKVQFQNSQNAELESYATL